jgi:hypothetical protein
MNNEELFSDLFAYRFALLDYYENNEREIIKKLKIKLFEWNYQQSQINELLFDFYRFYSIEITLEEIENANVLVYMPEINYRNSIFQLLTLLTSNITNEAIPEEEEQPIVSTEDFEKLPIEILNETIDNDCAICIDKLKKGNEIVKLPCNHLFHVDCIKSYFLNYNNKCPMCRSNI